MANAAGVGSQTARPKQIQLHRETTCDLRKLSTCYLRIGVHQRSWFFFKIPSFSVTCDTFFPQDLFGQISVKHSSSTQPVLGLSLWSQVSNVLLTTHPHPKEHVSGGVKTPQDILLLYLPDVCKAQMKQPSPSPKPSTGPGTCVLLSFPV